MTDFSRLLNPEQFQAATAGDGPILCLAAAGTGKTRTLVHRVAYLVENGVPAERIILLTFTNRAAREMLGRAQAISGAAVDTIWSGTFHSICARLLRRYGAGVGCGPGFRIIDEDDQRQIVGQLIKESVADPKDFPKKEVVAKMISEAANEEKDVRLVASRWLSKTAGVDVDAIAGIAAKYAARKAELNSLDFDDLLVKGLELVSTQEGVRELLQEHFLHVLVDEYQDTNTLQARFTDILAGGHRNIMAVGDDFQCIYTWRGARIENILEFPNRWPGCCIIKLERNYRSVPGILDAANAVMSDFSETFEKRLRPIREGAGILPLLYSAYDGRSQAAGILEAVEEARSSGRRYRDVAVLYRSHYQSIEIQIALSKARIPFRITSGIGVFEQLHVKDVMAYLRLVVDPADELSFLRLVRLFPGVGERGARSLWKNLGGRFECDSAADRERLGSLLPAKAIASYLPVSKCFAVAREHLAEENVGEIIEDFCDLFYEDHLKREFDEAEAEERLEDVMELSAQIAASPNGLKGFLDDVALMTNLDARENCSGADAVTLSTVHQAKGMEWPVVLVPWCCEGMFPSGKAVDDGRIDEERRLFYVALTRAKDELSLFVPQMRKMHDGGMYPVPVSQFVRDIPAELLEKRRAPYVPEPVRPQYRQGRRW